MNTAAKNRSLWVLLVLILLSVGMGSQRAGAAISPPAIGNFGPTGLQLSVQADQTLLVLSVRGGSPAQGIVKSGQVIKKIQGKAMPQDDWGQRVLLGKIITDAEAADGGINLTIPGKDGKDETLKLRIPIQGAFSDTWPVECPKSRKIIEANAAYLRGLATSTKDGLTSHSLENALALLSLLSTGDEKDLQVVRLIYQRRMGDYRGRSIGSNTWHNGYQGIAACEYYLRTGDETVMPLINAICESARRYEVQGGWANSSSRVNPEYVAGGLVNAAGTNLLTTLLLAKQCGAVVDDATLLESLRYFYRFAGHGTNPYGNHRPDDSYVSNNGKTEQLAVAMQAASKAENGEVYAMARDKCALFPHYTYRTFLRGHTGGIGTIWYGLVSSYLADSKPELYRNRQRETQWFYELSRRSDGSFGLSGAARYDNVLYGRSMLLGLTAPMKTLQITGAQKSRHSKAFTLPELPWGRPSDLVFFDLNGGRGYQPLDPIPHNEMNLIGKANPAQRIILSSHPEHVFRVEVAKKLRDDREYDLIEELLESPDPLARHTGCMAINNFMPWNLRASKGWLSSQSIGPNHLTQRMFDALIAMVCDEVGPLWLVDQSMIALAAASPKQTMTQLDAILPWLDHGEWWLRESAAMAVSPALSDAEGAKRILPRMATMLANSDHAKGRQYVESMLARNVGSVHPSARHLIPITLKEAYSQTPVQESVEGKMDPSGFVSYNLANTMQMVLSVSPELALEMAALSAVRLPETRPREIELQLNQLVKAAGQLDQVKREKVGIMLAENYLPYFLEKNKEALAPDYKGPIWTKADMVNKLVEVNGLIDPDCKWHLVDNNSEGGQEWYHSSFEPKDKPEPNQQNRYRKIVLPPDLENWHGVDFDPEKAGWRKISMNIGRQAPENYHFKPAWQSAAKDAGEVIFMRKVFHLGKTDPSMLRMVIFARQGYRVYLNGRLIHEDSSRSQNWLPKYIYLDQGMREHLKEGRNVLAATSFLQYFRQKEGDIDVYLEGLDRIPPFEILDK